MSFDWTEFLELAEAPASSPTFPGPPEAALRSAASRAYYAAFHYALEFAYVEGYRPSWQRDDHRLILDHFRHPRPPDRVRRKVALELDRLRGHRREADYDSVLVRQPASLASQAIGMAKSVIQNIRHLNERAS